MKFKTFYEVISLRLFKYDLIIDKRDFTNESYICKLLNDIPTGGTEDIKNRMIDVMFMRYGLNGYSFHTFKEISSKYDITETRIIQIHSKFIRHTVNWYRIHNKTK
jgi:DNA-directed RNA polymerase sigma subunit (sigma70/sigma32)